MPYLTLLNPRTSLRARIAFAIGGISLLLTLLVASSVDYMVSRQVSSMNKSRLGSLARAVSSEIDRDLYEHKRDISGLVALDLFQSNRVSNTRKREILDNIHATYPDCVWIGILNLHGRVVAGTNGVLEGSDASKKAIFVKGRIGSYMGDVHPDHVLSKLLPNQSDGVLRVIDIATPIYDTNGQFQGVVCAYLNWDWITTLVKSLQSNGEIPRDCSVLIESRSHNIFTIVTPYSSDSQGSFNSAQAADLSDTTDFVSGYVLNNGYRDFGGLGWKTIVRQDTSSALAPAHEMHSMVVACGLIVAMLTIAAAWALAGRITQPLEATTLAADAINRGDFTENLPAISGKDEIARLSASLRTLVNGLKSSDGRHRSIIDSSLDPIFITGTDQKITYANNALCTVLGYTIDELRQMNMCDLSVEGECETWNRRAQQRREGISEQYEVPLRQKSGKVIWAQCSASPFFDEQSEYAGTFYVMVNITERKLAENTLAAALKREVLLNEIAQCMRESTNPSEIQFAVVKMLGTAMGAERCIFMIADSISKQIRVESQWFRDGLKPYPNVFDFGRMNLTADGLFPNRQTLIVRDVKERSLSREMDLTLMRYNLHSLVIVPLYDREQLVAGLAVYHKEAPYDWSSDEVELIELVAAQVRSAVDSARLTYREHRIATVLQNALQPINQQKVPGLDLATYYKPALDEASIGGDFFDVFKVEDGVWALVIADVSGKGLDAAVQVATVRNMLRYVLYEGASPDQAAARLNTVFYKYRLLTGFVTLFVALYNVRERRISFCSCGHEPMLFWRASDKAIFELNATGMPLGVDRDAEYNRGVFDVMAGDGLVLYTDGLSEAGPDRSHLLGTDGLAELLATNAPNCTTAQALRNRLMKGVVDHADGMLRDDACLIAAIFD